MFMVYVDGRPVGEPCDLATAEELSDNSRELSPWSFVEIKGAPGRPKVVSQEPQPINF